MKKKLLSPQDNKPHVKREIETSKCPKCGADFHCSTSSKCWCYEIDVPTETMEKLQEEYDGCLCPDCLKEYAR